MPSVQDILSVKGEEVHRIPAKALVLDAIQTMNQHKIGALLVMKGEQVVGMFTERDVLRRVIGEGRQPADVTVAEVMTKDVICWAESCSSSKFPTKQIPIALVFIFEALQWAPSSCLIQR